MFEDSILGYLAVAVQLLFQSSIDMAMQLSRYFPSEEQVLTFKSTIRKCILKLVVVTLREDSESIKERTLNLSKRNEGRGLY